MCTLRAAAINLKSGFFLQNNLPSKLLLLIKFSAIKFCNFATLKCMVILLVKTPKRLKRENFNIVINKSLVEIISGMIHDKAS